jgi:hypothetical protein
MKRYALAAGCLALLMAGCPRPITGPPATPSPVPKPTPTPAPTPPPAPYVPSKREEFGKIFNGMQYKVRLETDYGTTATRDRNDAGSYTAEVILKAKVPKPHRNLEEITQLNPKLPELFPLLPQLVDRATVSPFFDNLYRLKVEYLQDRLNRLDPLLSRHNFYDCETILEMQNPETKRRALFIQADMDVDEDGSDSDRVPVVDGSSLTFQPMTSYRWLKKTQTPNPFLAPRQLSLENVKKQLGQAGLTADRSRALKASQRDLELEIEDLKKHSFLVGAVDPFIVVPLTLAGKSSAYSVGTGDYCVVVYDGALYPAIVGDIGPRFKMGEASMRICKELSARSSSINRPVSDLKVTYLVFPGTNERPWGPPDLPRWRERCAKLLEEFGGTTGELFTWVDLTAPPPPPPPPPAPATPAPDGHTTPVPVAPGTPKKDVAAGTPPPAAPAAASPRPASPAPTGR